MSNTSAIPWLPTTSAMPLEEVSLAEQVAAMLHAERQVMILITGSDSGRVSGFLAELTHAVSDTDSVLRIKASIEAGELFILLAGQLNLQAQGLDPMQLATEIGNRLQENAPIGNFVLLCEGAHEYSNALLESIRQLSNYPINIVLSGRPKLYRRLWRPALSTLRLRMNYRLDLNEWRFTHAFKWLLALTLVIAVAIFAWQRLMGEAQTAVMPPPKPMATLPSKPVIAVPESGTAIPPAPKTTADDSTTQHGEQDQGLSLVLDPTLKQAPKP